MPANQPMRLGTDNVPAQQWFAAECLRHPLSLTLSVTLDAQRPRHRSSMPPYQRAVPVLQVAGVEKSLRWYVEVLGFTANPFP